MALTIDRAAGQTIQAADINGIAAEVNGKAALLHAAAHQVGGADPIALSESQLAGYKLHTQIPLGMGDTFTSDPVLCGLSAKVRYAINADQGFTARVDFSANGSTSWSTGSTITAAAAAPGNTAAAGSVGVTNAYARLVVIGGSTTGNRLTAATLVTDLLG